MAGIKRNDPGGRAQTRYKCKACNVFLCVPGKDGKSCLNEHHAEVMSGNPRLESRGRFDPGKKAGWSRGQPAPAAKKKGGRKKGDVQGGYRHARGTFYAAAPRISSYGGREDIEKLLRYIVRKYIHEQFSHIFEIFDSH